MIRFNPKGSGVDDYVNDILMFVIRFRLLLIEVKECWVDNYIHGDTFNQTVTHGPEYLRDVRGMYSLCKTTMNNYRKSLCSHKVKSYQTQTVKHGPAGPRG